MKINGTLKTVGIAITIILAIASILWAVAGRSGELEKAVKDIAEQKKECKETKGRVNTVEKAVIKIETHMEHMITMQGIIFKEITGRDPL